MTIKPEVPDIFWSKCLTVSLTDFRPRLPSKHGVVNIAEIHA